ncbi:hypothetical protein EBZ38_03475 [bacterium]|nr:hypothetical protein [bacterium]NDC94023.1 hypothetical protein [bacterium]NDD83328.1 hypothetical protein [bacterium]
MGYTHYWQFKKPKKGTADKTEKTYQSAIKQCASIVKTYYVVNGGLSGFTAHTPIGKYGGLQVNGKGDDAHEEFSLREHYRQNFEGDAFNFCKTAQKPYDIVVVACLIVLKHRLKDLIVVSSDGYSDDWKEGLRLAKNVLKLKNLSIPKTIREYQGPKATQLPRFQKLTLVKG